MWYKSENGNLEKPNDVDMLSSKAYVFVRKDFVQIPESGSGNEVIPAHWEWLETKIRKEDYTMYLMAESNAANIDYIAMMTDVEIPTEEDESNESEI